MSDFSNEHIEPPLEEEKKPAIQVEFERVKSLYTENPAARTANFLIIGDKGSGKTRLLGTLPTPTLIYSFDPGGTDTLKGQKDSGDVLVVPFEEDSPSSPKAYMEWQKVFRSHCESGFFSLFASVALDSITTFADALMWQIMYKEGRALPPLNVKRDKQGMQIQDWGTLLQTMQALGRDFQNIPCHTVLTGHIAREKDEVLQYFIKRLMLPGQSSVKVPLLVSEVYYLLHEHKADRYTKLLTEGTTEYAAGTRLGGNEKLQKWEPPDLQAVLKKVGMDFEDKKEG